MLKYKDEIHELSIKKNLEATEKSIFVAKNVIAHKNSFPPWSSIICFEMEQFVLVTLSVYNSSNNPTIVTKQELPEKKPEQNPTYQKDTIKKGINQHLTTSTTSVLNKVLESPRIKLSNSNTMNPDGIGTGVLSMDFAQSLNRKNVPIPDIYFTLLHSANITPTLLSLRHAKRGERGAWIQFEIWTIKVAKTLQARIYSTGFCAHFGRSSGTLSVKGQRIFTFGDFIY